MASSDVAYTNYVGNTRLKFSWSLSGDSIVWSLSAEKGDSGYRILWNYQLEVNGQTISESDEDQTIYDGTVIASGSFGVTSTLSVYIAGGIGQYSTNAEGSDSWDVDAYSHITKLVVKSKTVNSITFEFTTDKKASIYVKNLTDGTSWLNNGQRFVSDVTSGTFTIYYSDRANTTRLTPNKTYQFEMLCRNTASGLDTSTTITAATYQIAQISSASNFNHGDNGSINLTNPSNASTLLVMKIGNTQILTKSVSAGSNTITFTQDQLDNICKLYGNGNSLTVTYIASITVNGQTYTHSKTCTITLTGNQKTVKVGVNGVKRAKVFIGVNGSVKKAVVWVGVNNVGKRCI